jgi:hypothetical protein
MTAAELERIRVAVERSRELITRTRRTAWMTRVLIKECQKLYSNSTALRQSRPSRQRAN